LERKKGPHQGEGKKKGGGGLRRRKKKKKKALLSRGKEKEQ